MWWTFTSKSAKKWWNLSKHSPSKADNKWWLKYALSYHCVNQILLLIMKTRNFDQDIKVNRPWKWDQGPMTCAILTCTQHGECLDQLCFFSEVDVLVITKTWHCYIILELVPRAQWFSGHSSAADTKSTQTWLCCS